MCLLFINDVILLASGGWSVISIHTLLLFSVSYVENLPLLHFFSMETIKL